MDDLETLEFADLLGAIVEDQHLTRCAQVCVKGTEEDQAEQHAQRTIDEVLGAQDMEEGGDALEADREADLLEQMPLRGHPESEKERLASWLRLPRQARDGYTETSDIFRKKHSCRCYVLPELHKTVSVPPGLSDARDVTTQSRDLKHTQSVTTSDLIRSITKWESMCSKSSIAVCVGTTYDQAWIVRESESLGSPSSHACLRAVVHGWTRWARWPKLVRCDRGTHNRGAFGSTFAKNGVVIRPAGLEAPEQIGSVER